MWNSVVIRVQTNQYFINRITPLLYVEVEQQYYLMDIRNIKHNKYYRLNANAIKYFGIVVNICTCILQFSDTASSWSASHWGIWWVVFCAGWVGVGCICVCVCVCVCAAGDKLCLQESDCYRSQNELHARELNDSKIPLFDVPVS